MLQLVGVHVSVSGWRVESDAGSLGSVSYRYWMSKHARYAGGWMCPCARDMGIANGVDLVLCAVELRGIGVWAMAVDAFCYICLIRTYLCFEEEWKVLQLCAEILVSTC